VQLPVSCRGISRHRHLYAGTSGTWLRESSRAIPTAARTASAIQRALIPNTFPALSAVAERDIPNIVGSFFTGVGAACQRPGAKRSRKAFRVLGGTGLDWP